jgi:hypothetical protein
MGLHSVQEEAEAIQSTLPKHRVIKDGHPFFNASVESDNRGTAGVPFDQRITTQPRKYGKIARCDFSGSIDQLSR